MAGRRYNARRRVGRKPGVSPESDGAAIPEFYADAVLFEVSVYGFALIFGVRQPGETIEGKPPVRRIAKAYLSPQHAKALARILAHNVQDYEQQVGPIA